MKDELSKEFQRFARMKEQGKTPDEVARVALSMGEERSVVAGLLMSLYGMPRRVAEGAILVAEGDDHEA